MGTISRAFSIAILPVFRMDAYFIIPLEIFPAEFTLYLWKH